MEKLEGPNPFRFTYFPIELIRKRNRLKSIKQAYWAEKWDKKNNHSNPLKLFEELHNAKRHEKGNH